MPKLPRLFFQILCVTIAKPRENLGFICSQSRHYIRLHGDRF
ncbi:hypothetical protein [Nostoc sp. 106C]|nr:hypothetical protein [Nostoc sp. 106C]